MRQISFFFFNDTATTEIYTLSLHDALPISGGAVRDRRDPRRSVGPSRAVVARARRADPCPSRLGVSGKQVDFIRSSAARSEEHTSELQSRPHLVCRLLLVKKKVDKELHDNY